MNTCKTLLAGLVFIICFAPAVAEEQITVGTSKSSEDGMVTRSVYFVGACGDECLLANLSCGGPLEAELIDIPSEEAAKSLAAERSLMILKVDDKSHEMPVESFSFTEMNGTWGASARAMDSDAIYKGVGAAKSFTLSVAGRSKKLPVTVEVQAWAKACLN